MKSLRGWKIDAGGEERGPIAVDKRQPKVYYSNYSIGYTRGYMMKKRKSTNTEEYKKWYNGIM